MAVAYQSISAIGNDSAALPLTVTKPSGVVDGDLMLATATTFSNRTITWPSGWSTPLSTSDATVFLKMETAYKVASSEGASYDWTLDLGRDLTVSITRVTGQHATPVSDSGGQANTALGTTDATAPSISPGATNCLLFGMFATTDAGAVTFTAPGGMTERADVASTNSAVSSPISFEVTTEVLTASGATGTRVATMSAQLRSLGQLVAIAPAAAGGTAAHALVNSGRLTSLVGGGLA